MKFKFVVLMLIFSMLLIGCNGSVGPQGPMGPPGPPGECTDEQCEIPELILAEIADLHHIDGDIMNQVIDNDDRIWDLENEPTGAWYTREVEVEIYCDDGPINEGSVKDVRGFVSDNEFACHFTIDNGGKIQEACIAFYCVPVRDGQPTGYAPVFDGVGRVLADAGNHYRTVDGVAEWQRPPTLGNKWGVRLELANYDRFTGEQAAGSTYVGKRYPWTSGGGDHWQITIPIP